MLDVDHPLESSPLGSSAHAIYPVSNYTLEESATIPNHVNHLRNHKNHGRNHKNHGRNHRIMEGITRILPENCNYF